MCKIDEKPFPRGAIIAAGALIGASLVATGVGRYQALNAPPETAEMRIAPRASVELYFVDTPDGGVIVRNAVTMVDIMTLAPDQDAFIRATVRAISRKRRLQGIGPEVPFELALYDEQKLVLTDPVTGHNTDLRAFGRDNYAAFERILIASTQMANAAPDA